MKSNHGTGSFPCKTLMKLFATGLACAAILIGSPISAASVNGNIDNTGSLGMSGDFRNNGTDNGQGIAPQNDKETLKDVTE